VTERCNVAMSLIRPALIFDHINKVLFWVSGSLLLVQTLSISLDVFMRYYLNRPMVWVDEVNEYLMVFITFLGTAWVLKTGGHIRVDTLLIRLKPRAQAMLNIVTFVLAAVFCLILAWYGIRVTWYNFEMGLYFGTRLQPPVAPIYAPIPLGFFLLSIQFVRGAHGYWRGYKALGSNVH